MKQLKPAGTKLLAEDANFRAAHNRFNAEPIFVYVNTKAMEREEEERLKHFEEQNRLRRTSKTRASRRMKPKLRKLTNLHNLNPRKRRKLLPRLKCKPSLMLCLPRANKRNSWARSVLDAFIGLGSSFFRVKQICPKASAWRSLSKEIRSICVSF